MTGVSVVRRNWDRLSGMPGGRWIFSRLIGRMAPYSGTVGATVLELAAGRSRVGLRDRRRVRNHLGSVHAIALMNVAELSSGLVLLYTLPGDARAILTGLSIVYLKKARGRLEASCTFEPPDPSVRAEHELVSEVRDAAGDVVARATARWLVSPVAAGAPGASGAPGGGASPESNGAGGASDSSGSSGATPAEALR